MVHSESATLDAAACQALSRGRKMKKSDINKIKQGLKKIETTKIKIAALRDELREQTCDLQSILDSVDAAVEYIEAGQRYMDDAVEELSQYL